ncbi:unnamed protein product [Vitrella brassicaformis CCMP3155]|uniref:Autophagy-related protein 27 n=1 Tax=Vitrella brassicaformis (strain CCMP3155) TaxID=1169540 RepID=A0A0G4FNZ4_VITBC|nr:unnamed protein product [Vitrella brassicaformis CCMP3155]|mmetsp:Transcript_38140/g.108892  ORF Transcript_38140/g.108892 Transcript_38140/m.108892 type:complete len:389 (-) Transcript_38140:1962-3128(-)|eukprot:CEM15945.1 unnamed protein product [Vitrella brassicaformis CCMP3155]
MLVAAGAPRPRALLFIVWWRSLAFLTLVDVAAGEGMAMAASQLSYPLHHGWQHHSSYHNQHDHCAKLHAVDIVGQDGNTYMWDLSLLAPSSTPDFSCERQSYRYVMNMCRPVHQKCNGKDGTVNQFLINPLTEAMGAVGIVQQTCQAVLVKTEDAGTTQLIDPYDPLKGIRMEYSSGETCETTGGPRKVAVHIECDPNASTPLFHTCEELSFCMYELKIKSQHGCFIRMTPGVQGAPNGPAGMVSLSQPSVGLPVAPQTGDQQQQHRQLRDATHDQHGMHMHRHHHHGGILSSISHLVFFAICLFALYIGFGTYINVSLYEMQGLDAVPHIKFWREVPALMQDFLSFLVKIVGTVLNTLAATVRSVMRRAGMQPPDVAFPTRYGYASV